MSDNVDREKMRYSVVLAIVLPFVAAHIAKAFDVETLQTETVMISYYADTSAGAIRNISAVTKPVNFEFAALGSEFLKPQLNSLGLNDAAAASVKSLPAVPAGVLMALSGFLCVSLAKDRRVYLAMLVGLFWAGHAGFEIIPQLALRINHTNHNRRRLCTARSYLNRHENNLHGLRAKREIADYIGLLRYLEGIPQDRCTVSSLAATLNPPIILPTLNSTAFEPVDFIPFSPAFIFNNLARGPPLSGWKLS